MVFIQGPPGTGKTYFLEKIVESAVKMGKTVILVASTNAAGGLLAVRTHVAASEEIIYRLWSLSDEILDFFKGGITNRNYLQHQLLVGKIIPLLSGLAQFTFNDDIPAFQ